MLRLVLLVTSLASLCSGFSARLPRRVESSLSSSSALHFRSLAYDDDMSFQQVIIKARECAFSDRAQPNEARHYLHEILLLESECSSGGLTGDDVCRNIDEMANIVAHLRDKASQDVVRAQQAAVAPSDAIPLVLIAGFFGTILLASTIGGGGGQDTTPLTMQEWSWAYRDGYLDTMASHFIRNGGF